MEDRAQKPKRFFYTLDGIRGLAAVLVAMLHIQPFLGEGRFEETQLAVETFFLLSGIVMANAYEQRLLSGLGVWQFTAMRVIRIYPLYILGCLITVLALLAGIGEPITAGHLLLSMVLALFLFPNPTVRHDTLYPLDNPAWTLFFELAANIAYARFIRSLNNRTLLTIMAISALGLAIGLYTGHTHSLRIGWTLKGMPFGFCRVGYSFFAGVLVFRIFKSGAYPLHRGDVYHPYMALVIMGVIALLLTASPPEVLRPYYDFAAAIFVLPVILYAALWFEPVGFAARVFKFLGAISYALYALHAPIGQSLHNVLLKHGIMVEEYAPYAGIFLLVGITLLSWLLDRIYDTPVRKYLMSLLKQRFAKL